MKSSFPYLILLILSLMIYQSEASEPDSLQLQESGIDLYAIGGLGMTAGDNYYHGEFHSSPALVLGMEIPFTKAHFFSFEFFGHWWIGKLKEEKLEYENFEYYYIDLGNNTYSQIGLSTVVKGYIGNKDAPFRVSFHLGYLLLSPSKHYSGDLDIGLGAYFRITKQIKISIGYRLIGSICLDSCLDPVPSFYTLSLNYKLN